MRWFIKALCSYATFRGRSCRREYWLFYLFSGLIAILLALIDGKLGLLVGDSDTGLLTFLFLLAILLPTFAVSVRRLHDTGHSGAWLLIALVPLIGAPWLLTLLLQDGDPEDNRYGPNPPSDPGW